MIEFYIEDKHGNQYTVSVTASKTALDAFIIWQNSIIGQIQCVITDANTLEIGNIEIFEDPILPRNGLFSRRPFQRPHRNFRQLGLGTAMLKWVISQADKLGLKEICGFVIPEDAEKTPYLLNWYKKHGFIIADNEEYLPNETVTICRVIHR